MASESVERREGAPVIEPGYTYESVTDSYVWPGSITGASSRRSTLSDAIAYLLDRGVRVANSRHVRCARLGV